MAPTKTKEHWITFDPHHSMTAEELSTITGRDCIALVGPTMSIEMRGFITAIKYTWGKLRFYITPAEGTGGDWFGAEKVKILKP